MPLFSSSFQLSTISPPAHTAPDVEPLHTLSESQVSGQRSMVEELQNGRGSGGSISDKETSAQTTPITAQRRTSPARPPHPKSYASMDVPTSPGLRPRPHQSPSRHHGLSALSPLQGLSPMQGISPSRPSHMRSMSGESDTQGIKTPSAGGHSRAGSVTRSLSRRQSVYQSAAEWGMGKEVDENETSPVSLFSRLTLVKAPATDQGLRRRSKSSSALAPIVGLSQSADIPATSPRAPRRSFASSFNTFSPITPAKPLAGHVGSGPDAHRISGMYADEDGVRPKSFTPDEVVELARGLTSPVLMPEGGFKGAELKRRKSAGATFSRGFGSLSSASTTANSTPEKPPTALEPVEYVQLDDDMLLPFVDRPEEVKELMRHPSNEKMFTLLRATFPKDRSRRNWQEIPAEQWNWEEFKLHLTATDRIECPDYAWIFRARAAVRQRSVALWEKVGVCLGCDDRLLNAGGEEIGPQTWGGLEGYGDDDDPTFGTQVWIEGIEPVDPRERARAEADFIEEFGEIVEDDPEATAGMTALLGSIGEENQGGGGKRETTAQRAGTRFQRDPLMSPARNTSIQLPPSPTHTQSTGKSRSKSFVGLTILSSASPHSRSPSLNMNQLGLSRSPSMSLRSPLLDTPGPILDRGPGSTLFPSSFSTLSAEPNLGRAASGLVGGLKAVPKDQIHQFEGGSGGGWRGGLGMRGIGRKASGTGLSESAITFASESDYAHSAEHHD